MKRTALKRSGHLKRHVPMRRRSVKRAALAIERAIFVRRLLAERPICEAGEALVGALEGHVCGLRSVDVHEPLTRARGGSILDEANALAVCRRCHDQIGAHPALSLRLGLLRSGCGRTA